MPENINFSIEKWDKIAVELSTRAEELDSATEAFADTIFLNVLKAKQNQIIFGRRGMGKSHLLKRIDDEYRNNFNKYRIVPIFINGSQIKHQADVSIQLPQVTAFSLYVEFIKSLVLQLHSFICSQIDPSFWDNIFGTEKGIISQEANLIVNDLNILLQGGEVRFLPSGEASDELKTISETASNLSGGLKLSISDPKSIGWKIDMGAGGEKKSSKSGVMLKKIKGQVILPFSEVSRMIQKLLDLLDNATLVILFDEWSAVDVSLDTQPYLAEMIKQTMSSITQMHVKLACIPIRTRLSTSITPDNPIPLGYEEGDDISADIDLDSVVFCENDLNQFIPFFLLVLKRHIGVSLDWVKEMIPVDFEDFIYNQVFENPEAFSELCQASAGVPRDFLNLFRNATSIKVARNEPHIQLVHIRSAAEQLFNSKKASFSHGSPSLSLLEKIYKNIIAKNRTYYFLLKEEFLWNPYIQMLWSERLIHKMPAGYYDTENHEKYHYYQIDYGKCVDLLAAEAFEGGKCKAQKWVRFIPSYTILNWIDSTAAILFQTIKEVLPQTMGLIERRKALAQIPAGTLKPIINNIIVDDSYFKNIEL